MLEDLADLFESHKSNIIPGMDASRSQRDLIGYGPKPPNPKWPGSARIAVNFVLNYEEGGENSILYGDKASEAFLSEIVGAQPIEGARHMSMESIYEYGSRVGVWRILELFKKYDLPLTVYGVAMALERNAAAVEAFLKAKHEIASHGWRWIHYQHIPIELEREHMRRAIEIHRKVTGERPLGWYTGRTSPNTRKLVVEDGGFVYDADDYNDELPFYDRRYIKPDGKPQLVVPYTLDVNDMRFASPQGFNSGEQFLQYLKDSFDVLYEEGGRMLSVGLHCRLVGRPGRIAALDRFLAYVSKKRKVWVTRRIDIARHWLKTHPAKK
jgi:putative urate catabolism protein